MAIDTALAQIQADYQSLANDKANIKTSLEGKGVSVPSNFKFSGIPSLIDSIEQGGGGIDGCILLYSNNAESITYTSTSAGTAKTITGITGICTYPFVVVIIENNNNPDTSASGKFRRSCTVISNNNFAAGTASVARYGNMLYYNTSGTATNTSSTSYGLWGYTIATSSNGSLTIRGRCNSSYFASLSGTYKIRVIGVKF